MTTAQLNTIAKALKHPEKLTQYENAFIEGLTLRHPALTITLNQALQLDNIREKLDV